MISSEQAHAVTDAIRSSNLRGRALREQAMRTLAELAGYNWCGIYRLEGDELVLDAYVGAATDHTRIPVGRGVCGTAVAQNANQIVTDVRELTNYLACSVSTRSEIVVLIHDASGQIRGQIDIDGHEIGAFDDTDEALLESIAAVLSDRWE